MKKYIIITALLLCVCIGVVVYAIMAPSNSSNSTNNEQVENQEYTIKQSIKGCEVTIFKTGVYTSEEGKELFEVYMNFTNTSNEARAFSNTVGLTVYQDGVELEQAATHENNNLKIKDGATISVGSMFILRSSSDVMLDFSEAYMKDVIDSISYSIK